MSAYLQNFWGILVEIAPFMVLGMLAAGLVHEALGHFQRLRAFAMKRSLLSLSFFNLSGFTLPICSCGVVPLAVGLRNHGVPFGNVFSFIYTAPATSIAAVILSLAVFGAEFALFYIAGALLSGFAIGALFYLLEPRTTVARAAGALILCDVSEGNGTRRGFLVRAIRWAAVDYGSRIALDLMLGLALAALIVTVVSVHEVGAAIAELPYWQGGLVMILFAIPLYVCSLPGILVGGALVLGGFTPALLWVFLVAGPVTNLGDINVLRRRIGWRRTLIYVGAVVATTLLWGWVIQLNLDWTELWSHVRAFYATRSGTNGDLAAAFSEVGWLGLPLGLHYAAVVLLAGLTLHGAWLALRELLESPCLHCRRFQRDLRLTPSICQLPCWKRRLLAALRGRVSTPADLAASGRVGISAPDIPSQQDGVR
jgi:uncharacterized membrane protein YraQ (UPF0718 family)